MGRKIKRKRAAGPLSWRWFICCDKEFFMATCDEMFALETLLRMQRRYPHMTWTMSKEHWL